MKHVLQYLFFGSVISYGSIVTSVSCSASTQDNNTVLFHATDTSSCFGSEPSHGGPWSAYLVSATASSGKVDLRAVSNTWMGLQDFTRVIATASSTMADTVIFPGSGLATLRVTLGVRWTTRDNIGTFTYSVDGESKQASLSGNPDWTFSDRDFLVELGSGTELGWIGQATASAGVSRGLQQSNGIEFFVGGYRLYDATGSQIRGIEGVGLDGAKYLLNSDNTHGPVLTQHMPEPSTLVLMTIGTLGCLQYARASRRRARPQLTSAG